MSSVQRFLKQIPADKSVYGSAIGAAGTGLYELVPGAGNVVGNYPGASSYVQALQANVIAAINSNGAAVVVRDMGKTIRAPMTSPTGTIGYYRQVQVLFPGPISTFIGGVTGSTFGVSGSVAVSPNSTYFTAYAPVVVGGVLGNALYNVNNVLSGGAL